MYLDGKGVPADAAKAVAWYTKAAEQGDVDAQDTLGGIYQVGACVPEDPVKAVAWFSKAANQGYAPAQFHLGSMYDAGDDIYPGVPKDADKVLFWYSKAAAQGDVNAQFNLAMKYHLGLDLPKDPAKALAWFTKAAQQGHAVSMCYLGAMYTNEGSPERDSDVLPGSRSRMDLVKGYAWITLALPRLTGPDSGWIKTTKEDLKKTTDLMTPEQVEAGEALAKKLAKTIRASE